jgi:hypothetical protein
MTIGAAVSGDHKAHKQVDETARIKMHFDCLFHSGQDPNSAAATVIGRKASYRGPLRRSNIDLEKLLKVAADWNVASSVSDVLCTAQKHILKNTVREP